MRILFVSYTVPYPPTGGAAVRIWSLMKALSAKHEIELLAFGTGPVPEPLAAICSHVHLVPSPLKTNPKSRFLAYLKGLFSPVPWMVQEYESHEMEELVSQRCEFVDVVVTELLCMSHYLSSVQKPLRVYDAHNLEYSILEQVARQHPSFFRRLHARREAARVRPYEALLCRESDLVVSVTAQDALALSSLYLDAFVRVVPISVVLAEHPLLWAEGTPRLCFVGDLSWLPNVDAVFFLTSEVLPRLASKPELVLAGRNPPPEIQALAGPQIKVTGAVPDMAEVLQGDTVLVVPLRIGSGMRVKILQGMAWGLPIISTSMGCMGIDHAGSLLEANGVEYFAKTIDQLLANPAKRAALSAAGRKRVAELYGHESIGERFIKAIEEARSK